MTKAYAEGQAYSKRWTASRFKMPLADWYYVREKNLKQIIAELVKAHAPDGTTIRSHLVDCGRGFFMTVEPSIASPPPS
jgi:hypothetical protein